MCAMMHIRMKGHRYTSLPAKEPKQAKYNFETMKAAASSKDPAVRKQAFIEYFERFHEFPSFLFDNESKIDETLYQTMQDLIKDPETTKDMHKGIDALLGRLPS
jgi:hypothetical protein